MTATPLIINTIKPIIIPENSNFYCLIGKLSGSDLHTFFQIGYMDENNNAQPLVEIGKVSDGGLKYSDDGMRAVANALFSKTGSVIKNEKRLLRKSCFTDVSFEINYSAYKINNEHYFYFLTLLKQIEISNLKLFNEKVCDPSFIDENNKILEERLFAYVPSEDSNEYQYRSISSWEGDFNPEVNLKQSRQRLVEKASNLSFSNTCRHTSIDFLDYILSPTASGEFANIPTFFMRGMPCSTAMNSGGYTTRLYLLPLPPNAYELNSSQNKTIKLLYQRMQELLQKDFDHPNTRQKFNLLNNIYENLIGDLKPEICFLSIIAQHSLRSENKEIINTHRGWHWPLFHQTKTHQMFEQFENDLYMKNQASQTTL